MRNADVAVEEDRIVAVGKDLKKTYQDGNVIDATGKAILPGLINAHNHLFQTLYRGAGDDMPGESWQEKVFAVLSRRLGREGSRLAALLSCIEMIKSGTTCVVDSHFVHLDKGSIEAVIEGVKEVGIRAVIARAAYDARPGAAFSEFNEDLETAKKECENIIRKWHGKEHGRVRIRPEPLSEFWCSLEMIQAMRELASRYNTGMNMHCSERLEHAGAIRRKYGKSPVEYLESNGILGPDVLLAHCVWVSDRDMKILKANDVKVAHNPVSNQYLADGVAPICAMIRKGVTVGIATDGAYTNNSQDMFEVMKLCVLMHRADQLDKMALSSEQVVEMATINGARALGMSNEIGSIEEGKKADLILVDLKTPELVPVSTYLTLPGLGAYSSLVYCGSGKCVDTVVIDGKIVLRNRRLVTLDEREILGSVEDFLEGALAHSELESLSVQNRWRIT